jgi:hypothetical protein
MQRRQSNTKNQGEVLLALAVKLRGWSLMAVLILSALVVATSMQALLLNNTSALAVGKKNAVYI